MTLDAMARRGLTGNELKLIAMITMTIDHIGMYLFPRVMLLRIIGRLAMPIYAYMIAEGCRHTRSRGRYLGRIAAMAALCQAVYFIAMGSVFQCILVTFSMSVLLICVAEQALKKRTAGAVLGAAAVLAACWFVCRVLPGLLPGTDFAVDYRFFGVLLPALVYFSPEKLLGLAAGLVLVGLEYGGVQWWALGAVPLLWLYNGQRGKRNIGPLFYWYYPIHLVVLYGISLLM